MASPSSAQFQSWTDRIAAILKLDLAGAQNELTGATVDSLANLVDGSADPTLQAALMGVSNGVDNQSLPSRLYQALPPLLGRAPIRDWITALNSYLISEDGGSYAGIRAALADKAATVHPLFAEAARLALGGDTAFADSDGLATTVFCPNYVSLRPQRVYVGADGSLAEETTDAASSATADVTLFVTNAHTCYIGSRFKFSKIVVALSTLANVTIAPTFQYWDGNQWATLTATDNSVGFTKNDTIEFTIPANWTRSNKDSGGTAMVDLTPLFYIRIARTASVLGTPPVGTCISIVPAAVLTAPNSVRHLGVDQPPLAIVRITGVNICVVTPIVGLDYLRFLAPGVSARALTPIGADVTLTLAYTGQDGVDDSQASSTWTAPAALGTKALSLHSGDTGVRAILATSTVVTTATQGVFEIYAAEARTPAL